LWIERLLLAFGRRRFGGGLIRRFSFARICGFGFLAEGDACGI
jgi:hypothetical protein